MRRISIVWLSFVFLAQTAFAATPHAGDAPATTDRNRATGDSEAGRPIETSAPTPTESESTDANVSLIENIFHERHESAVTHEERLRHAIETEDEGLAAEISVSLVYSLNRDQKKELLEALRAERQKSAVTSDPRRLKMVDRLLWAVQEIFKAPRSVPTSAVETAFKDKVEPAFQKADAVGNSFYENLDKAQNSDEAALKKLLETYTPQALLDFMMSQKDYQDGELAAKLSKSLGWQDVDGNVHLDLKRDGNPPAGDVDPTQQTWTLGKTAAEIHKALNSLSAPTAHEGANATPVAQNRLQNFDLDRAPAGAGGRHFYQVGESGGRLIPYSPKVLYPEDKNFCEVGDRNAPKSVTLSQAAGWFFRPFANNHYGSYAGSREHNVTSPTSKTNNENVMVDLNTGREISIPGPYDPVPTGDELYMTVPLDAGLTFYDMQSLFDGKPRELFTDKKMTGVYQSIGQLSALHNGISSYRIITDMDGLSYRDYEIARGPGGSAVVRPQGDGPKKLCPDLNLSLPMISKDGKLLSAVDLKTKTTKIFNIEGGKCDEKIDLGMFTSKVDFSYDGKQITFHKMNNEGLFNPRQPYTRVPSDDYVSNIYVYNLESGEIGRLTNNVDTNAVYPAFRRDGKITFIQHPHQGAGIGGGEEDATGAKPSRLVTVDPATARKVSFDHFLPKSDSRPDQDNRLQAYAALGALWSQLCSPAGKGISSESAVLASFNLDPVQCKSIVEKYWDSFKKPVSESKTLDNSRFKASDLNKLTGDRLIAACPKPSTPPSVSPAPVITPTPLIPVPPVAADPVPVSCRHCHRPGSRYPTIAFDSPAALKTARSTAANSHTPTLAEEILARVRSTDPAYMMPPPGEDNRMTPTQIADLQTYLGL